MKKHLFFLLLVFSSFVFSQDYPPRKKLGFFTTLDAGVGFDLASIVRNSQAKTDYELSQVPPGKYNYGFSSQVGYQPISWFALAGGLRYSYIDPNYHLLYFTIQPYFFVNDKTDDDFFFISAKYGNKINQTAAKNAGFIGLSLGKIEPMTNNLGQYFSVNLENQVLDGEGTFFVGLTYGLILFSNKRY
ncbi:hypothetical protein SAMN05660477_00575 [Soonwooa buanensis]|uniref:Outer membrane protein beta-barrel domain-containing protein n=1 Tax=Soonwooa buanensis TaxID=619805 RepID=A0A1T5D3B3_9FLAO|nr:hypothetical protein [Soonwooa buanensis]SKB66248.1 hypothetical protein SAMN05660477_00575 [Soonwooa buanensis]